jgi:hypothetical protein
VDQWFNPRMSRSPYTRQGEIPGSLPSLITGTGAKCQPPNSLWDKDQEAQSNHSAAVIRDYLNIVTLEDAAKFGSRESRESSKMIDQEPLTYLVANRETGHWGHCRETESKPSESFDLAGAAKFLERSPRWLRDNSTSLGIGHERVVGTASLCTRWNAILPAIGGRAKREFMRRHLHPVYDALFHKRTLGHRGFSPRII